MTRQPMIGDMSYDTEYVPIPSSHVADMVEQIEQAGTTSVVDWGKGVVLLTMVGAKSGKIRKVPLMRVEHDGVYAVVASLGGAPKHPVWYYNLKAEPKLQVMDGAVTGDFVAREIAVDSEERKIWWDRSVDAWPDYAEYAKKTDRVMPIFVLEPVGH